MADPNDVAPGDRYLLRQLAEEPRSEPVHPDTEPIARDPAGEGYERATDEEVEALINEVLDDD